VPCNALHQTITFMQERLHPAFDACCIMMLAVHGLHHEGQLAAQLLGHEVLNFVSFLKGFCPLFAFLTVDCCVLV
jgi:hypothetical protein